MGVWEERILDFIEKRKKNGGYDKPWNRIYQKKIGFERNGVLDFIVEREKKRPYENEKKRWGWIWTMD